MKGRYINMKKLLPSLLAKKIIEARKEKNITQQQLADLTNINRAMISRLESMDYIPSIPQLEKLGEVLDFEPI
ncbi:helix-turn-helix domain-containing protein [Clostridium perfringens]|uniref:helix-turn-helix domain-containing protein n=1 Tax=Clostridium perfringens TaxID=1502 RepID=UPI001FA8C9D3